MAGGYAKAAAVVAIVSPSLGGAFAERRAVTFNDSYLQSPGVKFRYVLPVPDCKRRCDDRRTYQIRFAGGTQGKETVG
jgi:hypothetical protein